MRDTKTLPVSTPDVSFLGQTRNRKESIATQPWIPGQARNDMTTVCALIIRLQVMRLCAFMPSPLCAFSPVIGYQLSVVSFQFSVPSRRSSLPLCLCAVAL